MNSIFFAAPLMLASSLFIETSSWWVRAQAPPGSLGLFVSRSNIYLYGGRFFSLAFTSLTALWIETGGRPHEIALLLSVSFVISVGLQLVFLHSPRPARTVLSLIAMVLRLPKPRFLSPNERRLRKPRLFAGTAISALIFGLGTGLPLIAAVLVPEYRLSVSYLGQIVNSIGTLVVLFLVDQLLFRSLDAGSLPDDVLDYSRGRMTGFMGAAAAFGLLAAIF